jgi:hypothetical protein
MAQLHDPVRWLLLLHQIPPSPHYFRAKVIRRLSQLGALAIKNSAYILPESDETVENFQWLRSEIGKEGGDAWLFRTETLGGVSNNELVESFRSSLDPTIASPGAIWGGGHLSSSTPSTTWASGDIQGGDSGSGKFPISPLFVQVANSALPNKPSTWSPKIRRRTGDRPLRAWSHYSSRHLGAQCRLHASRSALSGLRVAAPHPSQTFYDFLTACLQNYCSLQIPLLS